MKILGIIPSRYQAERFPGKPLADINGKSLIQRVYEKCQAAQKLTDLVVATDDKRIFDHVQGFGGKVVMTGEHPSGTDRCAEAFLHTNAREKYDYVINIQGDEPLIDPNLIDSLANLLDYKTEIATAANLIKSVSDLEDPNIVKVVMTMRKQALYFSRGVIPFVRGLDKTDWLKNHDFYKHIGIYAFRSDILEQIIKIPLNVLEKTEKLEQLRWLGYGYKINVCITDYENIGVDTPEDIERVNKYL